MKCVDRFVACFVLFALSACNGNPNAPSPNDALIEAVSAGSLEDVKAAIEAGADPSATNDLSQPAIIIAAARGDNAMIEYLIGKGADACAADRNTGGTTIHHAMCSAYGSLRAMHGPLAARLATMEVLLDHGADLEATDGEGLTPLSWTILGQDIEAAKALIERGASVEGACRDGSLFHVAVGDRRADPGDLKKTLLFVSELGADLNARNSEELTPLMYSLRNHNLEAARQVAAMGADPDLEDDLGNRAIHKAAEWGDIELARLLVAAGAELDELGFLGKTPLELARERDHAELAEFLEQAMGPKTPGDDDGSQSER
ncbi:MAG: ankyrin repeat domain-containing protein [Phycisphaerales bacterium]|nr:MAG: ankyrin repeat domain-containing protein [Phycisphaerales bacterium]